MNPGEKVFSFYITGSLVNSFSDSPPFRMGTWINTGTISELTHSDGRRVIATSPNHFAVDDGKWFGSLSDAKAAMADAIEQRAKGLLEQAAAIRAEAALDRDRELNPGATEAA